MIDRARRPNFGIPSPSRRGRVRSPQATRRGEVGVRAHAKHKRTTHSRAPTLRGRGNWSAPRRGTILIVAMVILGGSLLIGASLLSLLHAGSAISAGARDAAHSRAVARSGLEAIAAELNRQRRAILGGESPYLESQYLLFEEGNRAGVVRLIPSDISGELIVSEAAKIDINLIDDAKALAATGLVDETLAQAIIDHRKDTLKRPFQSEVELLEVGGVTPEVLYGSLDRVVERDDDDFPLAPGSAGGSPLTSRASRLGVHPPAEPGAHDVAALADIVTVYAIEPALQENGKLRINLNIEWSEELRDRVADRFGEEIANGLKSIFDQGVKFDSERRMIELLRFFQVPPEEWFEATDSFTTEDSDYHRGRIDINTAPEEALRALPGVTLEQAAQMFAAQTTLSHEERRTIAWPAMLDILKVEQFDALAGMISTRSWTWRVRFEAGMVSLDDLDGPIEHAARYEAVIDLASPAPRIAYLRDISQLSDAVMLAMSIDPYLPVEEMEDESERADVRADVESESADDARDESAEREEDESDEDEDRGLDFGFDAGGRDLDFGGDDDSARDDNENEANDDDANESGDDEPRASSPPPPPRIGRWNPGSER